MPGCIGHNGVESSLDVQPMDTSCDVTSFRDRREPPIDVRLPVCQPLEATTSAVDLNMSNVGSRVKLGIHAVPEKLRNVPKPIRINRARVYRRLKKTKPRTDPCHRNDTTTDEVNERNDRYDCANTTSKVDVNDDDNVILEEKEISKNVLLRPDGCKLHNMCFDVDEFRKLNREYGPITLEAYALPTNNLCQTYCDKENPFLKHVVKGEMTFMCPMQSNDVLPMLQHFENVRKQYPLETRGIIVLPDINHVDKRNWKVILDKYRLTRQYPIGTYLYSISPHMHDNDDVYDVPNPIVWHVNVYLADHTVEDRLLQASQESIKSAKEKLNTLLLELENRTDRTVFEPTVLESNTTGRREFSERTKRMRQPKPHQPRFEVESCNLTNQQEDNPLLTFSAKISAQNSETSDSTSMFLLDCGASRDFVSHSEVIRRSLPTEPLPQKLRIV